MASNTGSESRLGWPRLRMLDRDGPLARELALSPGRFGLGLLPAAAAAEATTPMVCGYCSTGCGLDIHLRAGEAISLTPNADYPVNLGMACPKGWEALAALQAPDRATTPLARNAQGRLAAVDWRTALDIFVRRIRSIQEKHGPDSVAFLSTGQIATEEMALLGALAKFGMGLLHGDGNTRQCMATAVTAYQESFGFDAPPYTYADFEQSDVIVLVGGNLAIAHPIMWQRVLRNANRPQIVVVDPRTTETAMQAALHLPVYPKGDLALFYGAANALIERDAIDRDFLAAHTAGFAEFAAFVAPYSLQRTAAETGLPAESIERFVQTIRQGRRVSFWWTMGVNQSHQGVRTAQAIINLALMTGNIGRPGTGANSITGQCNAMGSRLFSNTTSLLGGRDFRSGADRREVAEILGLDEAVVPAEKSWPYHQILEGVLRGKIRALWVVGTNPAHSWINQNYARDVFDRLEFLAVQDMYHSTETARLADLVLPAAGWGEKEGTFINSERRIGLIKQVARAPGAALADFSIFRLIAEAWGCGEMFREWTSPERVFQLLKRLSVGRPCDFGGIEDYAMLDRRGGVQWPYPADGADERTQRRLFADGRFYHADGKARFVFDAPRPLAEAPSEKYPLLLLTGRGSAAQWHTQTRTGKSAVLAKLAAPEVYVEINPADAARLAIKPGETVTVTSQRGALSAKAVLTHAVRPGQAFVPMHYAASNLLTAAAFDPHSHQPAYKACAVRIDRQGVGAPR